MFRKQFILYSKALLFYFVLHRTDKSPNPLICICSAVSAILAIESLLVNISLFMFSKTLGELWTPEVYTKTTNRIYLFSGTVIKEFG